MAIFEGVCVLLSYPKNRYNDVLHAETNPLNTNPRLRYLKMLVKIQ